MSCKHPLVGRNSPGYWGGNPRKRFDADNTIDKIIALSIDKLRLNGMPYALWQEAAAVLINPTVCSCVKATSKQADIPCLSCYGTKYIPGYLKFGTKNYWMSSIESGLTLTNTVLDKTNRPFRIQLEPNATSGTVESPDYVISVANKLGRWESKLDGFTRDAGAASSIVAEFSIDSGASWHLLNDTNLESVAPTSKIRFRVTFTRASVSVKSPMFEMIRIRFPYLLDPLNGALAEPVIRIIPTWTVETESRENIGIRNEASGMRFWTLPLNYFNVNLQPEGFESRIADDSFVECRYGGEAGFRYNLTQFKYSDTLGKFTRQEFEMRRVVGKPAPAGEFAGEVIYRVF
jgi:hypothetical protein